MTSIPGFTPTECLLKERAGVLLRGAYRGQPVLLRLPMEEYPLPEELARLRYDYQLSASLELPGVVRALELIKHGNGLVLVLEDFGGQLLRNLIDSGGLPPVSAVEVSLRLARTLGELHRQRIIHKNLNPSNILVHPGTLETRLTGFDIASRLASEAAAPPSRDRLDGNLAYISPEQTGRMNRSVDFRTDLYSLGVTLYEMLTGRVPFQGSEPMALVYGHLAVEPLPPHQVRPEVPRPLSAVVMKLLTKNAEGRYQSAYGLVADLQECLTQLQATGTIADFSPGGSDLPATFNIPQKLYGREREVGRLLESFERVSVGEKAELLLISGYSGVGKSSLVNEVQRPLVARGGYFGAGKIDPVQNVPYKVWIQAFDGLLRQILSESEEAIAAWRGRLLETLGPNGRVVTDVVPQLEAIIGPQPPVPALGPTESQNRFNLVFQQFVGTFTRREHPLVLFLDDLQWADAASLSLLQRILATPDSRYLLIIGTYRDNEVQAGHGLLSLLVDLRKASASISEVALVPLALRDVRQLLVDTLHCPGDEAVGELAALVFQKTQGNPFFVNQFITSLHDRGLLTFDSEQGRWLWRLEQIQQQGITDNVAELMAERIATLRESTQELLKRAACIGNRFSLETVSLISESSPQQASAELWDAVQMGLLIPEGDAYKYVQSTGPGPAPAELSKVRYAFLHDRVQETARSLMSEGARKQLHLRIGRLLLERTPESQREALIFDIVNQLNQAVELIEQPQEREELARLNLLAGQRAMSSSAYFAALEYLQAGTALLPSTAWEHLYELAFSLFKARSECYHQLTRYDEELRDIEFLLSRSRSPIDSHVIYLQWMVLTVDRAQYMHAIQPVRAGLRELGIHLPEDPAEIVAATAEVTQRLQAHLSTRSPSSLLELPVTQDEMEKARIVLLSRAGSFAAYVYPHLHRLMASTLVLRSLEHGLVPGSAGGYVHYALNLGLDGDLVRAHELGQVGMVLSERLDAPADRGLVQFIFSVFVAPWCQPVENSISILKNVFQLSLECGNFTVVNWASGQISLLGQFTGEPLDSQRERMQQHVEFFRRVNGYDHQSVFHIGGLQYPLMRLVYRELPPSSFPWHDEALLLEKIENPVFYTCFLVLCLRVAFLEGDYQAALRYSARARERLETIRPFCIKAELFFYEGLLMAALYPTATAEERARYERTMAESLEALRGWSSSCAENFLCKYRLLSAEQGRLAGRQAEALALYEEAIEAAAAVEHPHEEALANELAACFHLARGRKRMARACMEEARYAYMRWGARAKVSWLEERYPDLLAAEEQVGPSVVSLDLASVLKASQAISGEVVLQELMRKLMSTMVENAGARRGVLLLRRDSSLVVEARQQEGEGTEVVLYDSEAEGQVELPLGLIRYVERTGESVVLREAAREGPFQSEEYVARQRLRSVLCMPVLKQKTLVGTLYLENDLVAGAFTPERCKVLELLAAQAAISIENARLYDTLEHRVQQRTRELHASNEELSQTLEQLKRAQAQLVMKEKLAWLGVLTSGIAHEIKNPLNFVNNFALLCMRLTEELRALVREQRARLTADTAEQFELIATDLGENAAKINEHGRRADGIVRSMLELSRTGGSTPREVDLNALVSEFASLATQELRARSPSLNVALELHLDPGVQLVEVMPQELGRVLLNLLTNAGHALEAQRRVVGSAFSARLQVSTRELGDRVELRVRDNGTGIPADLKDKIFTPFFTTKPAGQGTGLGLSISQDIIVRGHGGTLEVDSVEGQYTEFIITLLRRARVSGGALAS